MNTRTKQRYQRLNKEIENFIAAFEEEAKSESPTLRPDKMRFAEFCTKYLELKKTVLSHNSYVFYEMIINTELIPKFGKMKLREIKTYHVQEFIQYLTTEKKCRNGNGDCISPTTVRRYSTVLRSILSLAYQLEYTDVDVGASKRIIFPKTDTCEVEVYTEEEVQQILTALDSEPINIRAIVEMAIFTGMRRGEIVGLKWDDIDFTNRTVSVKRSIYKPKDGKALEKNPKSKSSIRTISIPEHLISTLLDYKLHQDRHISFMGDAWNKLDYVFTEEDGMVMNPQTPTRQFSNFLKRHNIRHLKFHGLRHTSATILLANGCGVHSCDNVTSYRR